MNKERIQNLLAAFAGARVLVVGDIYLDENVYGKVTGVSLEAPIPIFEIHERRYNPGAAGNAACNVAALGARTFMIGVVGDDDNARIVKREFAVRDVDTTRIVTDSARPTNTYGKLRAGGFNIPEQEVLRTDTPAPEPISGPIEAQIIAHVRELAPQVDAIVVTDQVASVATENVLRAVAECGKAHEVLTVGDSRGRMGLFHGFDIVVPNDREAGVGVGIEVKDGASLEQAARELLRRCGVAMITCGPAGIACFTRDGVRRFPSVATEVVDVTGAGDTVTAAVTVATVAGATADEAAIIGNAAAAVAIAQRGVVTVSREELSARLLREGGPEKVKTEAELKQIVQRLQSEGKRVVWTNGCFDILHVGHITYLERAAREGDVLVLGLNSDASVRAVKGPDRPIVAEAERAIVMSALACVDYVVVFDEASPANIIRELRPDVYSKGGDYTIDTINQDERAIVEGYGGRIAIIPGVDGRSTTKIVERIIREGIR